MINSYLKRNYHILTYVLLYISLLIGFFLNENITGGPKMDFAFALKQVKFLIICMHKKVIHYMLNMWIPHYLALDLMVR